MKLQMEQWRTVRFVNLRALQQAGWITLPVVSVIQAYPAALREKCWSNFFDTKRMTGTISQS